MKERKSKGTKPCQFECHAEGVMYREQFNGFTVPNGQGKRKKVKVLSIEY
jgi:hypothetical protein